MSMDPKANELNHVTPTIINMAPGQLSAMPQSLSNQIQYQSFDPAHPGPYIIQQENPVHFEVSYQNNDSKVQELTKQLDQGWYLCYRYFVVVVAITNIFRILVSLVGFIRLNVRSAGSDADGFTTLFTICTFMWDVYQLFTIHQAMSIKDLKFAEKAVAMMQIYIFLLVLRTVVQFNQWTDSIREYNGIRLPEGEHVFILAFIIAFVEGFFYLACYFGANKAKKNTDSSLRC